MTGTPAFTSHWTAVDGRWMHALVARDEQGPTVDRQQRTALRQVTRFALDGLVERPSLGLVQVRGARRSSVRVLAGTLRAILADRIEERLPELTCPVLVVRGGRDPIVPHRWAAEVARLAPRGRLEEVPRAPHCMVYSTPVALLRAAAAFLRSGEARADRS